jgi:hypothetical protein
VIAGIDYSSRCVDVVLLDEDSDAATWHRFELEGQDAFERARSVRLAMFTRSFDWDDIIAVGIEDPRGYNAGALYRIQGAVLSSLPRHTLVHPLIPSQWRKTVGLPGIASKDEVALFSHGLRGRAAVVDGLASFPLWPQDACDAYCIALATRILLERVPA